MKKILSNKFFLIGSLLLLLIAIPVTLFFISQQQELRSRAAPSSRLFFSPNSTTTSTQCSSFTVQLMVDPGQNIVSIVDFYLTYDPAALDILEIKESTAFPTVVRPVSITSGEANMSVSVGSDVTKAVQTTTAVATITFRPKAAQSALVQFDSARTRVFSLAPSDEPTENVLSTTTPTNIGITSDVCPDGGASPSPSVSTSPSPSLSPSPTGGTGGGGGSPTPTTSSPTPTTTAQNQPPTCTDFTVSPAATGAAPFSVLFTAKGNDPDTGGLIAKTTFNFGDGQVQDVTDGMNLKDVTVQTNHTYQNAGTFAATVTFTDNNGSISQSCAETLTVTGASPSATPTVAITTAPTATPTLVQKPTAAPTIPPTGGIAQTVGIVGFISLVVIGGFLLLAL